MHIMCYLEDFIYIIKYKKKGITSGKIYYSKKMHNLLQFSKTGIWIKRYIISLLLTIIDQNLWRISLFLYNLILLYISSHIQLILNKYVYKGRYIFNHIYINTFLDYMIKREIYDLYF